MECSSVFTLNQNVLLTEQSGTGRGRRFFLTNVAVELCFVKHISMDCSKIAILMAKKMSENQIELTSAAPKMWNASRFCVSSLRRGHANLLCIVPILVYVLPKQVHLNELNLSFLF